MRHVRMLGVSLAAVFVVAAFAASSAFAATPEWGKCVAQAGTGKYEDANCQTKAKGKGAIKAYEWKKGSKLPNVPFSGHSVGSGGVLTATLVQCGSGSNAGKRLPRSKCAEGGGTIEEETAEPVVIECEGETNTGEAVGKNKVGNVHAAFTGCKLFGSLPCTSAGAAVGEVKTNPLKGELGYINKAAHEVGIRLTPAATHGHFADFECGGLVKIGVGVGNKKEGAYFSPENKGGNDAIISPITPINQETEEFEQVFTVDYTYPTKNIPNNFEGKPLSALESYTEAADESYSDDWGSAGEELTNVNLPSEPGEIKG